MCILVYIDILFNYIKNYLIQVMKLSMDLMIKIIELYNMIYFIKNFINLL